VPIFFVLRAVFALISLLILALAAVWLYQWYHGELVLGADGVARRIHHEWKLWAGGALFAWSFLGRWPVVLLLAGRDGDRMRAERVNGRVIQGPSGNSIYLEDLGSPSAQPILFTHGWSMDSTFWYYARRDLSERFRLTAWDLPGLGRSELAARRAVSLSGYAQDLKCVIAELGDRRPLLVGHSIGGMIIQTLARDEPEFFARRVAGVVLLNTTYTEPLRTMALAPLWQALRIPVIVPLLYLQIALSPLVWLLQWQSWLSGSQHLAMRFGFGRHVTRSQLNHVALLATRNSPATVARGDLAMLRWDGADGARPVSVRTLVIGGTADIVTRPEASETIAAMTPHSSLELIEGANHMGPIELAERYDSAIAAFAIDVGS